MTDRADFGFGWLAKATDTNSRFGSGSSPALKEGLVGVDCRFAEGVTLVDGGVGGPRDARRG
ncbi:MAG: hypothetical protein A2W31_12450 [Planctomycetes bacterium RBG_16_64_10]|nr:MAG: hypothetical protein A2W31_12450 [Planctomycetes bacterium RBG_16_64_10]